MTKLEEEDLNKHIKTFIQKMTDPYCIVWDLETNGLPKLYEATRKQKDLPDVLSISAYKYYIHTDKSLELLDKYERYYYTDKYNPEATAINGLKNDDIITEKRGPTGYYPKRFVDDRTSFIKFSAGTRNFIGHNILGFDILFLEKVMKFPNVLDTMYANSIICPNSNPYAHGSKLINVAKYYNVNTEGELHTSSYDTEVCSKVFERMLQLSIIRMKSIITERQTIADLPF